MFKAIIVLVLFGTTASAQPTVITTVPNNSTNFVEAGSLVYFMAQDALWRTVYNNDYQPKGDEHGRRRPWQQPWQSADVDPSQSGWTNDGRQFTFKKDDGTGTLFFNAAAEPRAQRREHR